MRRLEIEKTALQSADEECHESLRPFIEALVSAVFGINRAELQAKSRGRAEVALARQTGMYLAHISLGLSLSQVGNMFGRDRTTVAHACARIEDARNDRRLDRLLDCLEAAVYNWPPRFLSAEQA